jgi:hypothetical protein
MFFKIEETTLTLWETYRQRPTFRPTLPTPFEHKQISPKINLLPNQIQIPGGVRTATTAGVSKGVAPVVAAAAALPAAAAAAIGTRKRIVRRLLETEGGAAPPHQEQGHLDVVPAKEERDPKLTVAERGMALHRLGPLARPQQE